jgi:imidazolonepropionase-like amidohydrolase
MKTTLVKADAMVDVVAGHVNRPGAILIRDGRIIATGPEAAQRASGVDELIDCEGQTLLPGLIDCHNHLSLDPSLDNYLLRMNDSIPELTIRAINTMAMDLNAGVTTSRCMGDKGFLDIECKKAAAAGTIAGPRLLVATRGIRAPNGHGYVGYPFSGVETIRQAVRENLSAGADLIKIYTTGTVKSPKGLPHYFSFEEVQTLVDEAHRAGVPVATHCIGGRGLTVALKAGIDVIEHGYFASDEGIEEIGNLDRWLVMTPSIFYTDARIKTLPPNLIQPHLQQREEVGQRMSAAIKSGIKFAVGTDGMHGGLAQEIKYLTDFGASAGAAIRAATIQAAILCGLENEIGTLGAGKAADVIGVDGNPYEDINALSRVATVIQAGNIIRFKHGGMRALNRSDTGGTT